MPTLTVVIPALNEERMLRHSLRALLACSAPPDEIIVVDNGSTDGTARVAHEFDGVRVILESRRGITYARTTGFDAAQSDIIARIDADSIVRSDWAQVIRRAFAADPQLGAIAGGAAIAELSPRGRFWFRWWYRNFRMWHQRSIGVAPMVYGFNGAMRREAWQGSRHLVGMGDLQISEDVDLTISLLRAGHRIEFLPKLIVKAHLFRTLDPRKLNRYYRTDGITLARHRFGNEKRWLPEQLPSPASTSSREVV